jgi:hypothetical protein
MRWTKNFNSDYFYRTDKKHMAELVTALYEQYATAKSYYDKRCVKIYTTN